MSRFEHINIHTTVESENHIDSRHLERIAVSALEGGGADPNAELVITITDDHTVRVLNREHRGLDENTDVLSFSFKHSGQYYGGRTLYDPESSEFIMPPGQTEPLGDVIISFPQAIRQAHNSKHSIQKEVSELLVHGILHLLGFDHENDDDAFEMNKVSDSILTPAENTRGLGTFNE